MERRSAVLAALPDGRPSWTDVAIATGMGLTVVLRMPSLVEDPALLGLTVGIAGSIIGAVAIGAWSGVGRTLPRRSAIVRGAVGITLLGGAILLATQVPLSDRVGVAVSTGIVLAGALYWWSWIGAARSIKPFGSWLDDRSVRH